MQPLLLFFSLVTLVHAAYHPGGHRGIAGIANRPPPLYCTQDSLIFYQDCRMCVCPRPHRMAKCFRKQCDLRTKDGGQCPTSIMKLDDNHLCPLNAVPQCKVDNDCPGNQLCCFDFCNGAKCMGPVGLDLSTGMPTHRGRGYAQ